MTTPDTSVVVAAFVRWHERHDEARTAVAEAENLIGHVAVETLSVLTRLPSPRRLDGELVIGLLDRHFSAPMLVLDPDGYRGVLELARSGGLRGGAVYDALVATTARAAGATLVTLDRRAEQTYRLVGGDVKSLA